MKYERNEWEQKGRVFSRATVQSIIWDFDKTAHFHQNCQGKNFPPTPNLRKTRTFSWKRWREQGLFIPYVSEVNWNSHPEVTEDTAPPLVAQDVNARGWGRRGHIFLLFCRWWVEDVLVPARSGQGESGALQPSRMLTMELGGGGQCARAIKRAVTPHLTPRVTRVWWKLKKWEVREANQKKCIRCISLELSRTVTHCVSEKVTFKCVCVCV